MRNYSLTTNKLEQAPTRFQIPATALILTSMLCVQFGVVIAKNLFPLIGTSAAVMLRTVFAAMILFVMWRPSLHGYTHRQYAFFVVYGISLAAMNLLFYQAIARIPLGIAVTVEFTGPLGVALLGSRRPLDLLWVALAVLGIFLLTPIGNGEIDVSGLFFAFLAGLGWAGYILLGEKAGKKFRGATGLSIALIVSSMILLLLGILSAGTKLLNPTILFMGLIVAVLSSAVPFSLDFAALKRIPPRVFGVLTSLEPVIAAGMGIVFLGEHLDPRAMIAIVMITIAALGASLAGR